MRCVPAGLIKRALNSKLPPTSLTVVLRLILSTQVDSNSITLTKSEYMALSEDTNWDTARMKLTPIRQAKLAHISTNEHLYITWLDATGALHEPFPRVEIQSPTRENPISGDWKSNLPRAKIQSGQPGDNSTRAKNQSPTRENPISGDWKSNQIDALDSIDNNNQYSDETLRSIRLLKIAGIPEAEATRYASKNQYDWLERQVFAFTKDLQSGKCYNWRGLSIRLDKQFRADPLNETDMWSDLWNEIYGDEAEEERYRRLQEENRRKYLPKELEDIILR